MPVKAEKKEAASSFRNINDTEREELIRSFLPLVKRVVHRLASKLSPDVDVKEMIN